jgi:hypothetical protein
MSPADPELSRLNKPDYTMVFMEPAYPGGESYADDEAEESATMPVSHRHQGGVAAHRRPPRH